MTVKDLLDILKTVDPDFNISLALPMYNEVESWTDIERLYDVEIDLESERIVLHT